MGQKLSIDWLVNLCQRNQLKKLLEDWPAETNTEIFKKSRDFLKVPEFAGWHLDCLKQILPLFFSEFYLLICMKFMHFSFSFGCRFSWKTMKYMHLIANFFCFFPIFILQNLAKLLQSTIFATHFIINGLQYQQSFDLPCNLRTAIQYPLICFWVDDAQRSSIIPCLLRMHGLIVDVELPTKSSR